MDIPPLMATTPGITEKRFTQDPLGTEAELTDGPDDANPFNSPEEREIVEAYRAKQEEQQRSDTDLYQTSGVVLPFAASTNETPTEGSEPFVFDDVQEATKEVSLPFMQTDGPIW